MKKALITGITGQDGSYLAEFLLDKGYEVNGIYRRGSTDGIFDRIEHLRKDIKLHCADLTDLGSLERVFKEVKPDEIYNLASQSHVGISFKQEAYTMEVNWLGVERLLNCMKKYVPKAKFYQASTSELFGEVLETPQSENTPFNPVSPYAYAKLKAHEAVKREREKGLYACSGILFNHESIPKNSPVILKKENGDIDILPIEDLFKSEKHKYDTPQLLEENIGRMVWNGDSWTRILGGTCYKNFKKLMKLIQTVSSCYEATYDHVAFTEENKEKETKNFKVGDKLYHTKYPLQTNFYGKDIDLAYFIGWIVGDGYISNDGKIRLTGTVKSELLKIVKIISTRYGWDYKLTNYGPGNYDNCKKDIWVVDIKNDSSWGIWLRNKIYTNRSNEKRVPIFILNSNKEDQKSFFDGYYLADGRKNGNERYKYKGFTTKSATLCLGLLYLFKQFSNQIPKVKCEYRNKSRYYYVQFRSLSSNKNRGKHLKKELNEIIKILDTSSEDGWFYDIQTESETFCTGPNITKIHNSPRRGLEFVTRKFSDGIARIKFGVPQRETGKDYLELGNLNSMRDWGFSGDYVRAMWLMLQQDKPQDYVIATGETRTVRDFVELAADFAGIDITWKGKGLEEEGYNQNGKKIIGVNKDFFRPNEVNLLLGDSSKARKELGWKPEVEFNGLVKMMVKEDLKRMETKARGERFIEKEKKRREEREKEIDLYCKEDIYKPKF